MPGDLQQVEGRSTPNVVETAASAASGQPVSDRRRLWERLKGALGQLARNAYKRACCSPLRPRQARFFVAFMSCRASIHDGDIRSTATPVSWPRLLRNSIGECDGRKPK